MSSWLLPPCHLLPNTNCQKVCAAVLCHPPLSLMILEYLLVTRARCRPRQAAPQFVQNKTPLSSKSRVCHQLQGLLNPQ